jgi:DNA polymerase III epsilon subunit-like protein
MVNEQFDGFRYFKGIVMLQQVFVDTEFTNFESPKLISIGLVTLSGEEFYAEAEYDLCECSHFVQKYVLPLLAADKKFSSDEIRERLLSWINSVGNGALILICYDSKYDREMLEQIFRSEAPNSVLFRSLGSRYINGLKRCEFHIKNKQTEHHALHDARALRYSFRGWLRNVR